MSDIVRASINVPRDGTPVVLRYVNGRLQEGRVVTYVDGWLRQDDLVDWQSLDNESVD